jgi:hypothetical protein
MHFRWERIVHFVVQQISALFAYRYELAYRVVFFFQYYCCHKFLPQLHRGFAAKHFCSGHRIHWDTNRPVRRRELWALPQKIAVFEDRFKAAKNEM